MGFFTANQKRMAKKCTIRELQSGYEKSDFALERASYNGDKKELYFDAYKKFENRCIKLD